MHSVSDPLKSDLLQGAFDFLILKAFAGRLCDIELWGQSALAPKAASPSRVRLHAARPVGATSSITINPKGHSKPTKRVSGISGFKRLARSNSAGVSAPPFPLK
jgi:hypothetical protein